MLKPRLLKDYGLAINAEGEHTILLGEAYQELEKVNYILKEAGQKRIGLVHRTSLGDKHLIAALEVTDDHALYLELNELNIRDFCLTWTNPVTNSPDAILIHSFELSACK